MIDRHSPIPQFDAAAAAACRRRWSTLAQPLGSMGELMEFVIALAGLTGTPDYEIHRRAVVVLCADNGVVAQGVAQAGPEVTAILARGLAQGCLTVNQMARMAGADVIPVDLGISTPLAVPGLLDRRIAPGTGDITRGPAMTRSQAEEAVQMGIDLVARLKRRGYGLLCTGEAGIGNTTTSSAVAAVLLNRDAAQVTGRGAGLSGEGLQRKAEAIRQAIGLNRPDPRDPLDVLAKVGGLDLAGLCGLYLGGALYRVPIVVDGFIASVAALCAQRLRPESAFAMFPSHCSGEPAGPLVLEALGLQPLIHAGMRVGEGTGAVAVLPLLDMALAVYRGMPTFEELEIASYQPLA